MTLQKLPLRIGQVLGNAGLLLGVLFMAMPFVYMVAASFKPSSELFSIPVRIFPNTLFVGNYVKLLTHTSFMLWFANSTFISVMRTILAVVLALMAGYAFAKYNFRFKRLLFVLVIVTLTLPIYVVLVPLYSMVAQFGWINSYTALILPFTAQAIGVFLARQYLLSVPNEMLEAARMDGANEWDVFWRIILPVSQPVMATMAILFFSASWKDFIWPLVIVNDAKMFTVSLGLPSLTDPFYADYGGSMAGACLVTLPIVALFLIMQRRFIEGIMAGAVKG